MTFVFDRATAVEARGDGCFVGEITRDYWIVQGPNGGYLAAIALRGATLSLASAERLPRSMHLRYLSPPKAGEFELRVQPMREGGSLTILTVSLQQAGRECLNASVCFSAALSSVAFQDSAPPAARALDEAQPMGQAIPMHARFDARIAIGGGPRSNPRADTGGYLRFADGRPVDMLALAAFWDSWPPAAMFRAETAFKGGMPTVEASVYFRRQLPFDGFRADEHVLMHTHSALGRDGFIEEDAEVWSLDGQLLLQSRQLALYR
jgi:acyl-CoA thioesterase